MRPGPALLAVLLTAGPLARAEPSLHLAPDSPKRRFLTLAPVTEHVDTEMASATGKLALDEDLTERVTSPVSGRVEKVQVKVGDRVASGQALLTIASPDVESARAEAIQAQVDLQVSQRALERAQRRFADAAISKKELQSATDELAGARSRATRTRTRLEALGVRQGGFSSTYTLRAPLGGTVVACAALPGQALQTKGGPPLLTLSDLRTLWVHAEVYERDLPRVKVGDGAELHLATHPSEIFKARVERVGAKVDPVSRTVKVRLSVANRELRLEPDVLVKVTLTEKSPRPVVSIPLAAILHEGGRSRVIVEGAAGTFTERAVVLGPEHEGQVRILGGLEPGEAIVVEGAIFVQSALRHP